MNISDELRSGTKWCNYSYHDYSVSAILRAIGAEVSPLKPGFLAAIFFELRKMNDGQSNAMRF